MRYVKSFAAGSIAGLIAIVVHIVLFSRPQWSSSGSSSDFIAPTRVFGAPVVIAFVMAAAGAWWRSRPVRTLLFLLSVALTAGPEAAAQSNAAVERTLTSRVVVALPAGDAELAVDGETIFGQGSTREFDTQPLSVGNDHRFTFTATWMPNTYTTMTRSKTVSFRAGETIRIDLSVESPGDRVRVIYVPTPMDVAEAMVDLAEVRPDDVVYEPGCGDARITIAAIRRGARRAICVDIDGERARESQENVAKAGLADRIDVREGDALDVKDLSDVSVVFLYMGDHFDLLIRPVLWRDLKVGSRIVSHRFGMGDWQPDKTITVGDGYELHLWTITEQIKRRLDAR
jgi:uncharacterized protein (TIGR03000 family)